MKSLIGNSFKANFGQAVLGLILACLIPGFVHAQCQHTIAADIVAWEHAFSRDRYGAVQPQGTSLVSRYGGFPGSLEELGGDRSKVNFQNLLNFSSVDEKQLATYTDPIHLIGTNPAKGGAPNVSYGGSKSNNLNFFGCTSLYPSPLEHKHVHSLYGTTAAMGREIKSIPSLLSQFLNLPPYLEYLLEDKVPIFPVYGALKPSLAESGTGDKLHWSSRIDHNARYLTGHELPRFSILKISQGNQTVRSPKVTYTFKPSHGQTSSHSIGIRSQCWRIVQALFLFLTAACILMVNGGPPSDPDNRFNPDPLSPGEITSLRRSLRRNKRRRRLYRAGCLRVRIDGKECLQFDPNTGPCEPFKVPLNASYIEIVGHDDEGDLLLAVFPLPELESVQDDRVQLFVRHDGGQTLELVISSVRGETGEAIEGLVQLIYRENSAERGERWGQNVRQPVVITASMPADREKEGRDKGLEVCHNLPPIRTPFIGRDLPLKTLLNSLGTSSGDRVITLIGVGGTGKSMLAAMACHRLAREGGPFNAILWTSARRVALDPGRGQDIPAFLLSIPDKNSHKSEWKRSHAWIDPECAGFPRLIREYNHDWVNRVYRHLEGTLGLRIEPTPNPEERWRSVWKEVERRYGATLLVLDDLEAPADESIYRHLETLPPPHKALITSRHRGVAGGTCIPLKGMGWGEARAFLEIEGRFQGVTLEEELIRTLHSISQGIPLVMRLLLGLWRRGALPAGDEIPRDPWRSLDFLFSRSLESLDEEERAVLTLTAFLPAGVTRETIGSLCPTPRAPAHMTSLHELGLMDRAESDRKGSPDRYALVSSLEGFLRTSGLPPGDRTSKVVSDLKGFYLPFLAANKGLDRLHKIEPEIENILRLMEECFRCGQYESVLEIMGEIGIVLEHLGRWEERIHWGFMAMEAADRWGDRYARSWIHSYDIGWTYFYQGDWMRAKEIFEETLSVGLEENHGRLIALAKRNLGILIREEGKDCGRARQLLEESLKLWKELGERPWQAIAEGGLGVLCLREGFILEAKDHLLRAREIHRQLKNLDGIVSNLRDLSLVAEMEGNRSRAQKYTAEAQAILKKIGIHPGGNLHYAHNLVQFARIFKAEGRHLLEEAHRFVQDAIFIYERREATSSLREARGLREEIEVGRRTFVGREKELEKLNQILRLARRRKQLQLVSIDGPPGMGKSELVEQWSAGLKQEETLVARVHGCEMRNRDPVSSLQRIKKQLLDRRLTGLPKFAADMDPVESFIQGINAYSDQKPVVLIIDDYQELTLPGFWLWDLIRSLTGQVVVVFTGLYPLSDTPWERNTERFTRISLKGFNSGEICQFLQQNGISETLAKEMDRQSQGLPLSLSILTHSIRSQGAGHAINPRAFWEYVHSRLGSMPDDYATPMRKVFEVAAVTRCFNPSLLGKVLGQRAIHAMSNFRSFSSYVNFHQNKTVCLHEIFRKALVWGLRRENPARFGELVKRILPLCADPDVRRELPCLLSNIFGLISDNFVEKIFFPEVHSTGYPLSLPQVQPIRGGDWLELLRMDREIMSRHWDLPYPRRQQYLESLFELQGESFRLTKGPKDQKITGFCAIQRVTKKLIDDLSKSRIRVRDLLAGEPLLAMEHSEDDASYFLHHPVSLKESIGQLSQAALLRDTIGSIVFPNINYVITINYDEREAEFFRRLGFKEVEGTSERDKLGADHSVYALDFKAHVHLIDHLSKAISGFGTP